MILAAKISFMILHTLKQRKITENSVGWRGLLLTVKRFISYLKYIILSFSYTIFLIIIVVYVFTVLFSYKCDNDIHISVQNGPLEQLRKNIVSNGYIMNESESLEGSLKENDDCNNTVAAKETRVLRSKSHKRFKLFSLFRYKRNAFVLPYN